MWICGLAAAFGGLVDGEEPFYNPATNSYYELVEARHITWDEARDAAEARFYKGLPGYLVTITSDAENRVLFAHFAGREKLFMGATDEAVEGEWRWVTGPEAGTIFWVGDMNGQPHGYAHWKSGEPNNCCGGEHYGEWTGLDGGVWNDTTPDMHGSSEGYIVEYPAGGVPPERDCNGNGIDDAEDVINGTSPDRNSDGIPDECQVGPQDMFRRGDANNDGIVNLSDGIWVLSYLFLGDAALECEDAADANDDEKLQITDALVIFRYLFLGGPPPPFPGPFDCGYDAVVAGIWLDCRSYATAGCTSGPEGNLQETLDELLGAGVVDARDETGLETFPSGRYRLTLLAKQTDRTDVWIGIYSVSAPDKLVEVFPPSARGGATAIAEVDDRLGVWVDTYGFWRSESRLNADGLDHFRVFQLSLGGYIVTIEDVSGGGDGDFQDLILRVQEVE